MLLLIMPGILEWIVVSIILVGLGVVFFDLKKKLDIQRPQKEKQSQKSATFSISSKLEGMPKLKHL